MLWSAQQNKVITASKEAYKWAIDNGVAKEQASCSTRRINV